MQLLIVIVVGHGESNTVAVHDIKYNIITIYRSMVTGNIIIIIDNDS